MRATLKPRPGALEIFRDLQRAGVVQAVVSNSDRLVVDANLRAVGLHRAGHEDGQPQRRAQRQARIRNPICAPPG